MSLEEYAWWLEQVLAMQASDSHATRAWRDGRPYREVLLRGQGDVVRAPH